MSGLLDEEGKPVPVEAEPKAKCTSCRHEAPVSKFLGDEPAQDKCPICPCRQWEFI